MTDAEKSFVQAAVKRIRSLRQLGKDACMSTTRAQSYVLRALPENVLGAVAEVQKDQNGADLNESYQHPSK